MKRVKAFLASPIKVLGTLTFFIYITGIVIIQHTEHEYLNIIFGVAGVYVTEVIRNLNYERL